MPTALPEQFVGRGVGGGVGILVAISKERGKVEVLDISHQHIEQGTRSKKIDTYEELLLVVEWVRWLEEL